MITRRDFLRTGALAAAGALPGVRLAASPLTVPQPYFGLHPFIESNPKAVFVAKTRVPSVLDDEAKRRAGLKLAREIFVPMTKPGIPVSHRIIFKPNYAGTDAYFYEGVVMGLKELGTRKLYFVEANGYWEWAHRGFIGVNERQGVQMNETFRRPRHFRESWEMNWATVPDGVIYKRIPHFTPIHEPDTWMLNIAKVRSHGMCLTLSVKNEQGTVVVPYTRFCPGWRMVTGVPDFMKQDIQPDVEAHVKKLFESHVRMNYSRYNSQHELGPMHQEIWAQKTCDNQSTLQTGFAIIEDVYSLDVGDTPVLANRVMFGKDKFRLDVVAMYLGGHEPGNVNLFRTAKERGLTDTFNPWEIPVYEWEDGKATARKLSDFERTPIKTYYLQLPGEPLYHMVNEPFDYDKYKV
jgi:hypothetical protein